MEIDTLTFFGNVLWFIFGVGFGTAIMYFGPLIIEKIDERTEKHVRR